MKKMLIFIAFLVSVAVNAQAQEFISDIDVKGIKVDSLLMEKKGTKIDLEMFLDLSELNVHSTEVAVLTPWIVKDGDSLRLQAVGIFGHNRHIYYSRNPQLKPTTAKDMEFRKAAAPDVVKCKMQIPYMEWMKGCCLHINLSTYGCCGKLLGSASEQVVEKFPLDQYVPQLAYIRPQSEGEKVRRISGTAYIDFPVSSIVINPDYRNNQVELQKIIGTIDSVKLDEDIVITSLGIKGYASPESPYANNERLAKGRTQALREYVEKLYKFEKDFITTSYEPEDWEGLREYVANSELPHKDEILEIIDFDGDPDKKEAEIRKNWNEEYKLLLKECYPALRRSEYSIEYVIRNYTSLSEMEKVLKTAPQKLSLEEFYFLSRLYRNNREELNELWETAVRMYPDDETANMNAANSAISRGDYKKALFYLERAGNSPEVTYALGVIEALNGNYDAARPLLDAAAEDGIEEAAYTRDNMSNHLRVSFSNKNKNK